MKRMKIYWILLSALVLGACAEDKKIGEIEPIEPGYVLPQGKSPADDRIVDLFEKYGTYVLYEYTKADFNWRQGGGELSYDYTDPDPKYAGDMLDLLEEIWFKFYPEEFHEKNMPRKIFLTGILEISGSPIYARVTQAQVAVGYCSDVLTDMPGEMKSEFKTALQRVLLKDWINRNIIAIPDEFYEVSDYSYEADTDDPESPDYARARGFVANAGGAEWCGRVNWQTGMLDRGDDLSSFIDSMVGRTSEEWAGDFEYPLVEVKYNILREYILENYKIDLREIGDAVYE